MSGLATRPGDLAGLATPDRAMRTLLALGGLGAALIVGVAVAVSPKIGVMLAAAAVFAPIAILQLPLAIAIWTSTLFVQLIPGVSLALSAAGLGIAFIWFGSVAARREALGAAFQELRGPAIATALLFVWLGLSLAWTRGPDLAQTDLIAYAQGIVLFFIVATTIDRPSRFKLIAGAFVLGATVAVLLGLVTDDLTASAGDALDRAAVEGRLTSAGSDPNDLAAGLVPAAIIALGLLPSYRGPKRLALAIAVPILLFGLVATQSRGGMVAAVVGLAAALVVVRGHRLKVAALTLGITAVVGFGLATTPGAMDRLTSADNGGNGRTELWTIALHMWEDNPFLGVGLAGFREESPEYVRDLGSLQFVKLIVERPHIVHNTYLQLLAETGVIGAGLFLTVAIVCAAAAWKAAAIFERTGRRELAILAQAVVVASIARMAAMAFLSVGNDYRTWLIFAFGPGLLHIARRRPTPSRTPAPRRAESYPARQWRRTSR